MKRVLALTTILALTALLATAWAHTAVRTTSPKSGATAGKSLRTVSVTFKQQVLAGSLTVKTASGTVVSKGHGGLDPRDVRRVVVGLRSGLKAGSYVASWKATAADGHKQHSSWRFKLR